MEFVVAPPLVLPGLADRTKAEAMWLDDLDFMIQEVPQGVFLMTFHPQTIGRGGRLRVLDALIERANEHGARFATVETVVEEWRSANPWPATQSVGDPR
jgi:peptidoglycan/xylan/chitin deacetylase (PgdA/CDA1 family)